MSSTTPQLSTVDAERVAREEYGVLASASALPSERDQNFLLTTPQSEKFVLKIAKSDEDPQILDFQNSALRQAAHCEPDLALSRVLPTVSGAGMGTVRDITGRSYFVRLVNWLEGEVFAHAKPHDAALLASLGTSLARLDIALQDFEHPAMHRTLHWDLRHIALALEHLSLLSAEQRAIAGRFRTDWEKVDWSRLRTAVIHGDANDHNVLVRQGSVVGFLDFGDMVHSAIVCDLAIALTYAMLDKADPLAAAEIIVTAYHRKFPLQEVEIDALYPLTTSRLCMSLCYAAYNARVKSGDVYQLVTARPAGTLLEQLAKIPAATARDRFHAACAW